METLRKKHLRFTLIEVVVALGILSISLAGLLQLSMSAQKRMTSNMDSWNSMHMLQQAAEYLMLFDQDTTDVPEDFFNYPGYALNVHTDDVETELLPEAYAEEHPDGQLPLMCLTIELLRESDRKVLDSVKIDRINYESVSSDTNGSRN